MMTQKESFASRLNALLKEKGLTIAKAAELSKMSKSTLHNWTTGAAPQDFEALNRLSEILDSDFYFLLLGMKPRTKENQLTATEFFCEGQPLFDGICHVKITPLHTRDSAEGGQKK